MAYHKPSDIKAYKKEAANIASQIRKFHKKPDRALRNVFLITLLYPLLLIAWLVWAFLLRINDPVIYILSGAMLLLLVIFALRLLSFRRFYKLTDKNQENRDILMDAKNFTSKYDGFDISYSWDSIRCIRAFRHCILVLPEKESQNSVLLPVENLEDIRNFISENNIDVNII